MIFVVYLYAYCECSRQEKRGGYDKRNFHCSLQCLASGIAPVGCIDSSDKWYCGFKTRSSSTTIPTSLFIISSIYAPANFGSIYKCKDRCNYKLSTRYLEKFKLFSGVYEWVDCLFIGKSISIGMVLGWKCIGLVQNLFKLFLSTCMGKMSILHADNDNAQVKLLPI